MSLDWNTQEPVAVKLPSGAVVTMSYRLAAATVARRLGTAVDVSETTAKHDASKSVPTPESVEDQTPTEKEPGQGDSPPDGN